MKVTFEDYVTAMVYDEENSVNRTFFTMPLDSFGDWDSKPWALHYGDFVREAGKRFGKQLTAEQEPDHAEDGSKGDQLRLRQEIWNLQGAQDLQDDPGLPHGLGDGHRGGPGEVRVQEAIEASEEDCEVTIHSFGGYLGRRSGCIRGHLGDLQAMLRKTLRELRRDFDGEAATFTLPSPQPDPEQLGPKEVYVVIDFLPLEDPMHSGKVPILCEVRGWRDEEEQPQRTLEGVMLRERTTGTKLYVTLNYKIGVSHDSAINVSLESGIRLF